MADRASTDGRHPAAVHFLQTLHRIAEGDRGVTVNKWKVASDARLSADEAERALQELERDGLVVAREMGGGISITDRGVAAAEQALDAPARATQTDLALLRELAADVRRALTVLAAGDETRAEAEADLATLEAQIQSPRPKRAILAATLDSLAATAGEPVRGRIETARARFAG